MASPFAWTIAALVAALAHGTAHAEPAPAAAPPPADTPTAAPPADAPPAPAAPQPGYVVLLDPGPALARRMGVRLILRPTGDGFGNRRSAVARELPRPDTTDDPPAPLRLELPAGVWRVESSAPGFLSSTREFTVDATRPEQTQSWALMPDTLHADVSFPTRIDGDAAVAVAITVRASDGGKTWSCTARETPCTLRLSRGGWTVETRARGLAPARQEFVVADTRPLEVPLALAPGDDGMSFGTGPKKPAPKTRKVSLGLGLGAAAPVAVGFGLTVYGRKRYIAALYGDACDRAYGATCGNALISPIHVTGAGVGLLGAGVGLAAAAIPGFFDVPQRAWWGLLGAGGGLLVLGAAWTGTNTVFLDRYLLSGPLADINARVTRRLVAAAILGLGLGTTTGALTQLLTRRRLQRGASVAPYAGLGQVGLTVSGRF
ncbi:MAG: hypothetical protein JNL82_38095 [Myxococcales bacterium]|nr:hypothetical protein [Myxococcales bacterium]